MKSCYFAEYTDTNTASMTSSNILDGCVCCLRAKMTLCPLSAHTLVWVNEVAFRYQPARCVLIVRYLQLPRPKFAYLKQAYMGARKSSGFPETLCRQFGGNQKYGKTNYIIVIPSLQSGVIV